MVRTGRSEFDWRSLDRLFLLFGSLCFICALNGCATKGPQPFFAPNTLPALSEGGSAAVPDRWWQEFQDSGLDHEINVALGSNFELGTALQRLRAARAVTRREASDLFPDLNGFMNLDHTFQPQRNQTNFAWGLNAAYQVDLWGQIQSRIEAERLRSEATREDYQSVALSLAAEVARTWYSLVEAYAQLELLDEQLKTNRDGLKAVELRFAIGGEGGSPDVLRQRQLVQSTLEQVTVVKANIEVLEHQLAVLTGQSPQNAQYSVGSQLPDLPELPAIGLPADLLARRPDVRADYLAFAAADQDLEAAVTDQYPRLNLSASLVNSADRPETLFRDWFLSIGGQLIGPILDGGQRRAEVERTRAVRCQRFNEYRQTVNIALQEVEDGLALERYQIQRIEKLSAQLELAQQASEQLRQRFITADASYLDILSAIQSKQRLQRDILSARLNLILIRISLYLALAGDFDTRPQFSIQMPDNIPELPAIPGELSPDSEQVPELELNPVPDSVPAAVDLSIRQHSDRSAGQHPETSKISLVWWPNSEQPDCRFASASCNDVVPAFLTSSIDQRQIHD